MIGNIRMPASLDPQYNVGMHTARISHAASDKKTRLEQDAVPLERSSDKRFLYGGRVGDQLRKFTDVSTMTA